jgi:hypothetical protein
VRRSSRRYATALATDPGNIASVLVAFATTGVMPA